MLQILSRRSVRTHARGPQESPWTKYTLDLESLQFTETATNYCIISEPHICFYTYMYYLSLNPEEGLKPLKAALDHPLESRMVSGSGCLVDFRATGKHLRSLIGSPKTT